MGLVQKSISFCIASVIESERRHISQQSSVINSPRILVGLKKKLIYIFLIHRSVGHPVSRASLHQTLGQSQLHKSPSWAPRMLGAWPSHANPKGQQPKYPTQAHLKRFLMSHPLISHQPSKSHGQDQSPWDEDIALLTLQRPHCRGKGLEIVIIQCPTPTWLWTVQWQEQ